MKLLMKATAFFDHTLNLLAVLAGVLFIFMMLSVTVDVVMRYFLNRPMAWVTDIAEHSLLYITFLGAAWVLRKGGHVKMDLVLNRFKPRTQNILNIITSILGIIICLILTWYGAGITLKHFLKGYYAYTVLDIPDAPVLVIIPIGFFLLLIQFLRMTYGYLGRRRALQAKEQGS